MLNENISFRDSEKFNDTFIESDVNKEFTERNCIMQKIEVSNKLKSNFAKEESLKIKEEEEENGNVNFN